MRILHGYSSWGQIIGVYGCIALTYVQHNWPRRLLASSLLSINILFLYVNTWIAVNGMGIPFGKQFHILLAVLLGTNFIAINNSHKSSTQQT